MKQSTIIRRKVLINTNLFELILIFNAIEMKIQPVPFNHRNIENISINNSIKMLTNLNISRNLKLIFFLIISLVSTYANAQETTYDMAIAKFTGENKYEIEHPEALNGIAAPDFMGKTTDGKSIKLSDLKGKVVVLNFWFIACPPCRLEIKPLNEIVQQFKGKDVVFLSVAREKENDLRLHLKSNEFLFETIADPTSVIGRDIYHLFGYPTTIVIDKTGVIRYYTLGGKINEAAVRKDLQEKLVPVISKFL